KVDRLAYIGCDYVQSGRTAGGILGLFTGGNAKVGVIIGSPFVLGHRQRAQGFYQVISEEFKGISIVGEVLNNDSEEMSYQVVKKFLEANPEANALYFTTGGVKGGMKAVHELKKQNDLHIITCDLTAVVADNIKKGVIDATICQQPFRQGFGSVKLLFDYLIANRKPLNDVINTEIEIKLKYNLSVK
ncbi:MAG: substrate-binding domain-containing protein, partial [Peptostreptococcaceae bacterium]|nr:substrate-binding domain-containing protein [Peptostreptococcaceae bacterium]